MTKKSTIRDHRADLLTEEEAEQTDTATAEAEEKQKKVEASELAEIIDRRAREHDVVFKGKHLTAFYRALMLPRKKFADLLKVSDKLVKAQERQDEVDDPKLQKAIWEHGLELIALKMKSDRERIQVLAFLGELSQLFCPNMDQRGMAVAEIIRAKVQQEELMKARQEAAMKAAQENPDGFLKTQR